MYSPQRMRKYSFQSHTKINFTRMGQLNASDVQITRNKKVVDTKISSSPTWKGENMRTENLDHINRHFSCFIQENMEICFLFYTYGEGFSEIMPNSCYQQWLRHKLNSGSYFRENELKITEKKNENWIVIVKCHFTKIEL